LRSAEPNWPFGGAKFPAHLGNPFAQSSVACSFITALLCLDGHSLLAKDELTHFINALHKYATAFLCEDRKLVWQFLHLLDAASRRRVLPPALDARSRVRSWNGIARMHPKRSHRFR
jgi:hypothetical protein